MNFLFFSTLGFLVGVVFSSFFEWTLHRFVMHRPLGAFDYAFKAHALVHHYVFKADHTYHLIHDKDKFTIPMAWWNGPVLIVVTQIPFLTASLAAGQWGILCGSVVACSAYYGAYEYLHWCMHLPKERRLERLQIFRGLNGHHLIHHRYPNRNFNVVCPLADWCFGTLLTCAKVSFAQARGPSVPDVQPKIPAVQQCSAD